MIDYDKNGRSAIMLSRYYIRNSVNPAVACSIDPNWLYDMFDLISLVDNTSKPILCDYMLECFSHNGIKHYQYLNIWDRKMLDLLGVNDERNVMARFIHWYLGKTSDSKYRKKIIVRAIDKFLKLFF